jgi:molybdenum cofactor cytidylyltransferase
VKFGALVLAAGRAARMGGETKQLARLNGKALVSHVAAAALGAGLDPIVVVLGHDAANVRAALAQDLGAPPLMLVHAERYAEGMAESLKAGLAALPDDLDGAFILLADMPFVTPALIARVSGAFDADKLAAAPAWNGQRGNPTLLSRRAFPLIEQLTGDRGLGPLLNQNPDQVALIAADDDSCLRDIDTPEALRAARGS